MLTPQNHYLGGRTVHLPKKYFEPTTVTRATFNKNNETLRDENYLNIARPSQNIFAIISPHIRTLY